VIAGFVATLELSAIMLMKGWTGMMPQLDVIGMLSGMLDVGRAAGWIVHFIVGTVFYGIAYALLERALPGGPTVSGMVLGIIGWLVMMIALMPMAGLESFGMDLGIGVPIMTLILHLIFGAVLGWVGGALTAGIEEVHSDRLRLVQHNARVHR
jgi:uncharacterized membrane protein YagU involved in acid resistance